ncbi:hypothetical protein F3Y22_tig00113099pilonHSYRG00023 [Hibiscus syriacus]|uniref:Uncharacterized protein n=1 Tax=Hibiscus syriacus TaxID=106335 RepID=A0A6A2XM84_HIBSY|nr:hypothetical protein F3Y22_tig00113099pilonHSYRG00023 [Hibiscus syriacus]
MACLCLVTVIDISSVSKGDTKKHHSVLNLSSLTRCLLDSTKEPEFLDWLKRVSRKIHEYPELAFQEHETGRLIISELESLGIDYSWHVDKTGIVATVGSGVEPWFGLRADMDALPIHFVAGGVLVNGGSQKLSETIQTKPDSSGSDDCRRRECRLSEAIDVAGKLTELAGVKPSSDVSSRPMPRDSGNNGGDREKVQWGDGIGSYSNGQYEPSTINSQGEPSTVNSQEKPSEKNDKAKGCPEKRLLATIIKRMEEGDVARIGTVASVKAANLGKRLGSIEGANAAKQGSRRGKAIDVEAAEPRRKPDAIATESRDKDGATTSPQVVNRGARHDETTSVKAVKHRKGPGAIAKDKAVKPRVLSEQVLSQYAMMDVWSKLRRIRHKGTLKELKLWAKKVLERREVKELSKALTTAESIKDFGVNKNKNSKTKLKTEGSGMRIHDEGKSKDEECCSSSDRESPPNDEPDGESGEEMPEVLRDYPMEAESSNVIDELRIELSREEDKPRIEGALRVGSIRFISAKASRSQVQEELAMSKEFAEHVRVENMASETIIREGSKQGLAEDVQVRKNPSKTSRQDSKGAKMLRDKATMEKLSICMVGSELQPSC